MAADIAEWLREDAETLREEGYGGIPDVMDTAAREYERLEAALATALAENSRLKSEPTYKMRQDLQEQVDELRSVLASVPCDPGSWLRKEIDRVLSPVSNRRSEE